MNSQDSSLSRRGFIQASLAGAALAVVPLSAVAQSASPPGKPAPPGMAPLERRRLGRSEFSVPMLSLGGSFAAHSATYLDQAWAMGIRYFDTAASYLGGQSEAHVGQWLAKYPDRRKDLWLVNKAKPRSPKEIPALVEQRLKNCKTDYLDAFYIHGIGVDYGEESQAWPKSDELKQVVESLKKSGKIRNFGFSCHDAAKVLYLSNAAEGGFVDVIMVEYAPVGPKNAALETALDACHKAGIGLIAMKTMASAVNVPKAMPELEKLGLSTHQGVLHAVWSDSRFSAVCSEMTNLEQIKQNMDAGRKFKAPLAAATLDRLRETVLASGPTLCANCDGRCEAAAGSGLALKDIQRFVMYYECKGDAGARELYRGLAVHRRDASGADLAAASRACLCNLDFAQVVKKAERYFA